MNSSQKLINKILERKKLLFFLFSLWVCLEEIILGPYSFMPSHYNGGYDVTYLNIPRAIAATGDLFKYGINYWFPTSMAGIDLSAENYSHTFLWANSLQSLIMPPWLGQQLLIFFEIFFTSFFTYKICKDHLKLPNKHSIFAGMFFSVIIFPVSTTSLGISVLPFTLFYFNKIYEFSKKRNYIILLIIPLALFFSSCSTLPIHIPFTLPVIFIWLLVIKNLFSTRFFILFFIFSITVFAYHIERILALLLLLPLSHRINEDLVFGFENVIRNIQTSYIPIIIALLFATIFLAKLKDKKFNFLIVMLIIAWTGPTILTFMQITFYDYLSIFQGFSIFRITELFMFFLPLSLAYGINLVPDNWRFINSETTKLIKINSLILIIGFSYILYETFYIKFTNLIEYARGSTYTYVYINPEIKKLAENKDPLDLFRVTSIRTLSTIALAYGLETADGFLHVFPKRYAEFWHTIITKNSQKHHSDIEQFTVFDHDARLILNNPDDILMLEDTFDYYYHLNLLSLANVKYILATRPINEPNLKLISKPIIFFQKGFSLDKLLSNLKQNFTGKDLLIYENKTVLPRAFFTRKIRFFKDKDKLLKEMSMASLETLRDTVYLDEKDNKEVLNNNLEFNDASVEVVEYSPDQIRLSVSIDGIGILVISNSYNPFWKVYVDGKEKKLFPADHTFWGVVVEKGEKEIIFRYEPPYKLL